LFKVAELVLGSHKRFPKHKRLFKHLDHLDRNVCHRDPVGSFKFGHVHRPLGRVHRKQLVECGVVLGVTLDLFFLARKRTDAAPVQVDEEVP